MIHTIWQLRWCKIFRLDHRNTNIRFIPSPNCFLCNVTLKRSTWKDLCWPLWPFLLIKDWRRLETVSDKLPKRDHKQIQCKALPVSSPLVQQNPVPVLLLPTSPQTRSGVQTQFKHITCSSGEVGHGLLCRSLCGPDQSVEWWSPLAHTQGYKRFPSTSSRTHKKRNSVWCNYKWRCGTQSFSPIRATHKLKGSVGESVCICVCDSELKASAVSHRCSLCVCSTVRKELMSQQVFSAIKTTWEEKL